MYSVALNIVLLPSYSGSWWWVACFHPSSPWVASSSWPYSSSLCSQLLEFSSLGYSAYTCYLDLYLAGTYLCRYESCDHPCSIEMPFFVPIHYNQMLCYFFTGQVLLLYWSCQDFWAGLQVCINSLTVNNFNCFVHSGSYFVYDYTSPYPQDDRFPGLPCPQVSLFCWKWVVNILSDMYPEFSKWWLLDFTGAFDRPGSFRFFVKTENPDCGVVSINFNPLY